MILRYVRPELGYLGEAINGQSSLQTQPQEPPVDNKDRRQNDDDGNLSIVHGIFGF
jgi:hypothetical protein